MNIPEKTIFEAADLGQLPVDHEAIQASVKTMLEAFGENCEREGLQRTPERVARMYGELLSGYRVDPVALLNDALFRVEYDEMVVLRDIEFYSLCEHHLLPFMGRVHVGYIPEGQVIGLSKIPRIVDMFSRRLQIQERLTRQIGEFINLVLKPKGVIIEVEAIHLCSMMRGVKKQNTRMTTSTALGVFRSDPVYKTDFLSQIYRRENSPDGQYSADSFDLDTD